MPRSAAFAAARKSAPDARLQPDFAWRQQSRCMETQHIELQFIAIAKTCAGSSIRVCLCARIGAIVWPETRFGPLCAKWTR